MNIEALKESIESFTGDQVRKFNQASVCKIYDKSEATVSSYELEQVLYAVNFYFSQMAFVQLLFAYSLFRLMKSWITFFWVFYVVGELINEVFFKGSLSYIEIIMGATSLFYYYYKHGRKGNR